VDKKFEFKIGEKNLEFKITNLAERANGEIMVRYGDTQVLATSTMSENEAVGLDYFPLSVNHEERYYAAGKILGSRYIKREGKPSDNATAISRLIDRTIRPLFDKSFKREVQVIVTCLSWDEENDPDILGILGASLSLLLSDIPWEGPLGAVRIGIKDEKLILNPTYQEREESALDIVFSGIKRNGEILINMIEASAKEAKEELILEAVKLARPEIERLIELQEAIRKEFGKEKIVVEKKEEPELKASVSNFLGDKIESILSNKSGVVSEREGMERAKKIDGLQKELIEYIKTEYSGKEALAKGFFEEKVNEIVHEKAIKNGERVDGRKLDELRKISCEVGLIPRTHGSGLFCRGLTKSLSILTLGGPGERQLIEGMEIMEKKRFLHHYNFPPYSTGEVKRLASPSRREIGHGMLAERALLTIIPEFDDFPYTIRIVSEILCSNGSSSMASVCSSCLALMDAGVPIKKPISGIAVGLMTKEGAYLTDHSLKDTDYKLLTDIQGPEDFHGDMDFKVAGTRDGITALQMDVKILGIGEKVLKEALLRGKKARLEILDLLEKTIEKPREKLSPFAPKIYKLQIPTEKIGEVIGPKGNTIKRIIEETGATIDIEETGMVFITSQDEDSAKRAVEFIKNITREVKIGEIFLGKVKKVLNFGAFLELGFGQEGLLHSSRTKEPLQMGEKVSVKVISIDEQGRVNLDLEKPFKKYVKRGEDR